MSTYAQEKVVFAAGVLLRTAASKVVDKDVVLTYAYSSTVAAALLHAKKVCLGGGGGGGHGEV
jgi:translation initiation factor 2B subunit (eIF-2B alpha/beta/delta family)